MLLLNDIINNGFDGGQLVNGLAHHLRNVMMAKDSATLPLLEVSERVREKYKEQASRCPSRFLYQALRYCNQCDINYRESSNKRLLVELTLIEIAQETQADDVPSGGRRPYKSLKSLFSKLAALSQKKSASQVAATERPSRRHAQVVGMGESAPHPEQTSQQVVVASTIASSPTPSLKKLGGLSVSFKTLKNQGHSSAVTDEPEVTNKEEQSQFSQSDLMREWLAMCNRMPQSMAGLAARLKHVTPQITDYPNIELMVNNQGLLDQVVQIKGRIRKTMALSLHNGNIDFTPRLAKAEEVKPVLTKRELFDKLRKENHALELLRSALDLELS